jgi:hypothetical protein
LSALVRVATRQTSSSPFDKPGFRTTHSEGRSVRNQCLPSLRSSGRPELASMPSAYRQGRHVDDAMIVSVARSVYLDVRPWPFAALT